MSHDYDYAKLVEQINYVREVGCDYTVGCSSYITAHNLTDNGYNAYLNSPITDWETFQELLKIKVSDIYIAGPLGFECDMLVIAKRKYNITIRATAFDLASLQANNFYILPGHTKAYEGAIDILEIDSGFLNYYQNNFYPGHIRDFSAPHDYADVLVGLIDSKFSENRSECGQRCMEPSGFCHYCESELGVARHYTKMAEQEDKKDEMV